MQPDKQPRDYIDSADRVPKAERKPVEPTNGSLLLAFLYGVIAFCAGVTAHWYVVGL